MIKKEFDPRESEFLESAKESLDDAESLLREAAAATGEKAAQLRESALESLRRTRLALYDTQDAVVEQGRRAVRATDDYVHDNPWQAAGMAALAGLLVGLLIARR